jgi:hypothetical protein
MLHFFYLIVYSIYICMGVTTLRAEFFCSNKESRIHLSSAAQLKLYAPINNWEGTLKTDQGSSLNGSTIVFSDGALETNQQKIILKGTFDPNNATPILLQGNDILHADPGTIIHAISISGANNRIEGQPTFNTPFSLFDASTSLTLALQKKLNSSIDLNNGLLFLDDDLRLGEGVIINGPGVIACNQSSIELWGVDGSWNSTIHFINPDAINVNTHLMLSGIWTLSGRGQINGQGNVLDLSLGGKLIIDHDAEIGISDIKIRGLNDQTLLFANQNARVRFSDVSLELDNNFSMTVGGIFIDGPITFMLKDHNFLVDNLASITFDGVRGLLDSLAFEGTSNAGQLQLPLPIFVDHTMVSSNINANIVSGNLTILASSTFAESLASGGNIFINNTYITTSVTNIFGGSFSPTGSYLISSIVTASYTGLDDTFWVPVDENILIGSDVTIDASGNAMFFAHGTQPQIIVPAGTSLRLQNIELGRVNENTFNIDPQASLYFGQNFQLEMNQNLTFSQGNITCTNDTDVIDFRGIGGVKILTIDPPKPGEPNIFNVGSNSLRLQDVELNGLENMTFGSTFIDGQTIYGAIVLAGGARINISKSTNAHFVIEGSDNIIRILKNNLTLDGSLQFADAVSNEVSIEFVLTEGLTVDNQVFFGDDFAYLYSNLGKASLFFSDYLVRVINQGSNAFVMDRGSYLKGSNLFVGNFPIKQLSFDIGLSQGLLLSSDQTNALDSAFARNFLQTSIRDQRPMTAYHLHKKKEQEARQESSKVLHKKNSHNKYARTNKKRVFDDLVSLFYGSEQAQLRALATPTPITMPIGVGATVELSEAFGTIKMDQGSSIRTFGIHEAIPLNIIVDKDCLIEQGNQAATLKAGDALYILGRNNILRITDEFQIMGNIYLDEGAELIIECETKNNSKKPLILWGTLSNPANLLMPTGSRIILRGTGDVLFAPESKITSMSGNDETVAEFFLHDHISMGMFDAGTFSISGNMSWQLQNYAELFVGTNQQFLFGTADFKRKKHNFSLLVDNNSRIRLDGSRLQRSFNNAGQLSIAGYNASIIFDRGSELYIGPQGLFELNAINDKKILSNLTKFYFGVHTSLYLDKDATFIVGPNNYNFYSTQNSIDWDLVQADVYAAGLLKLAQTNIYGVPQNIDLMINASAEEIVRRYINRAPNLIKAFYFLHNDGKYYVRTRDGIIVQLTADEDDLSEDPTSGVITGFDKGIIFKIDPQGNILK